MFERAAPASSTHLEEHTMSTATSTLTSTPTGPLPRTATRTAARAATSTRDAAPRGAAPARPVVRAAGSVPGARRGRLVLTRRGRRLVRGAVLAATTCVVAAVLVLAWLGAAASVAPGASAGDGRPGVVSGALSALLAAEPVERVEVVVEPGDTLWQIARANAPERDPRSVVADIVRLNALPSTSVAAGAVLVVPGS